VSQVSEEVSAVNADIPQESFETQFGDVRCRYKKCECKRVHGDTLSKHDYISERKFKAYIYVLSRQARVHTHTHIYIYVYSLYACKFQRTMISAAVAFHCKAADEMVFICFVLIG
jgi:hypothetical protein